MKKTQYQLGDLFERFSSGKALSASYIHNEGLYPVYGGNGIRGFTDSYNVEEECVVVGRQGAYCGNVQYNSDKAYMTDHAIVGITNEKSNTQFMYYFLGTLQLGRFSGQAAQPGLSVEKLKRLRLELPSLPTQQKIASILSAYDNLIQNYKKQIEDLQTTASELYKEWFVRFRFPGYKTTQFENGIPVGWKQSTLSELGEFVRGKNITAEEMVEGIIPVISAGLEPSGYHNEANVEGVSLTISNSGANAGYLQINYSSIWAADCSYCNTSENIYFYYEMLNNMRNFLFNLQMGAAQPHVYARDVNRMKVVIPSKELIEKADEKLKQMHSKIHNLEIQITNLTQQRDLLLPRLMSGKLEVE